MSKIPTVRLKFERQDIDFTNEVDYKVGDYFFTDVKRGGEEYSRVTVEGITAEFSSDLVKAADLLFNWYMRIGDTLMDEELMRETWDYVQKYHR